MTTSVTRTVDVTVNRVAGVRGLASFGYPAIITNEAPTNSFGANRAKRYAISALSSVGTDFSTSGDTYDAASALASQTPKPDYFYVIKRDTAVARVKTITYSADFVASNSITVVVNGQTITRVFATDSATTLTALASDVQAALGVDTCVANTGQKKLTVTFDAEWTGSLSSSVTGGVSQPTATIATTVAGRLISDDIAEAIAETGTNAWYMLIDAQKNVGAIRDAAQYVETTRKMYLCQNDGADVIDGADTDDVASILQDNAYTRSALFYHDDSTEMVHAAEASRCLAIDPGQITFANKTLVGCTAADLTDDEIDAALAKNANVYIEQGSQGVTKNGTLANGDAIETTRDIDYFVNELEEDIFNVLTANNKIPATQAGLNLIKGRGQAVVNRMVSEGVFAATDDNGDAPLFTVPELADWDSSDKADGILSGCKVFAQLSGRIIKVEIDVNIAIA